MKSYALELGNSEHREDESIFLFHAPPSSGYDFEFTLTSEPKSRMEEDRSSHALTRKELMKLRDLINRVLQETAPYQVNLDKLESELNDGS